MNAFFLRPEGLLGKWFMRRLSWPPADGSFRPNGPGAVELK